LKTIEEMLRCLSAPNVTEFALVSGRLPCAKISGAFKPVDDVAPSSDNVLQMLMAVGGSRYVDDLGAKPLSWTARVNGIGSVTVLAVMKDDLIQARFSLAKVGAAEGPSELRAAVVGGVERPKRDAPPKVAALPSPPVFPPVVELSLSTSEISLDLDLSPDRSATPFAAASTARDFSLDLDHGRSVAEDVAPKRAAVRSVAPPPLPKRSMRAMRAVEKVDPGAPLGREILELVTAARGESASDVHIVSGRPAMFRVGGDLVARGNPLNAELVEQIVHGEVKGAARALLDADGSCDFARSHAELGRLRVNVTRQRTGYKMCMRLVGREIPTLESLGLPAAIGEATHHHQGLILVTGPTGHGKTSTMAAIVDIINRESTHHVISVEDPIEYLHPRKKALMSQREVGTHTRTFAAALKASLREDPDVIVVGELRDTETVRMALAASETGHLVLGTMNTPSAAKTIDRLIDLFPPADQGQVRMTLAGGLRMIVGQKLLPATGGGMVAAAEVLPGSIPLWSLIRDNRTFQIPSLQQRGKALGIIRLDDSLQELVRAKRTTMENARAVAESPDFGK
jgi:twitching motility protein PilT